ncbi:DUF4426 domain-containing protein [Allohahella marinimesophila]|uniref:DUF4426 domain-containing protein n=1 Tax=Allohahella marinimesophila TaxID=1054972 RepID=A0ABP7PAF2_9GAMM
MKFSMSHLSIFRCALLGLACLAAWPVAAEQQIELDNFQVHYAALPGSVLSEQSARMYQISRSVGSGFINVTVLEKQGDEQLVSRRSFVRGTVRTEQGEARPLPFQQVTEGGVTSSIANFWYSPGKELSFAIEFIGDPNQPPEEFAFKQTLFAN